MPSPRVALVIAAAIVVGVVLYLGRHALTPFIVGALIVYLLDPAVGWLSRLQFGRRRIPRGLAVLIVYLVTVFIVIEALALLLGPLISQLLDYVRDFPALLASLETMLAQIGDVLPLARPARTGPPVHRRGDGRAWRVAQGHRLRLAAANRPVRCSAPRPASSAS